VQTGDSPRCNVNLGANPWDMIAPDRQLQTIVDKIFPQIASREGEIERQFYKERGLEMPTQTLAAQPKKEEEVPDEPVRTRVLKKSEAMKKFYSDEVGFELLLDEGEKDIALQKLDKPFIRTSARVTVLHLKKYLQKKLSFPSVKDVRKFFKLVLTFTSWILHIEGMFWEMNTLWNTFSSRGLWTQNPKTQFSSTVSGIKILESFETRTFNA